MFDLHPLALVLVVAVSVFTAAAAFWDFRTRRIPNRLTLPMFAAGWVFQLIVSLMYGWEHLASAALGFLVGFGLLFVLWFVGGGGGGDVKLMGALSVWLGLKLTLSVLLVSTILVILATMFIVARTILSHGFKRTRQKYLATGKDEARPGRVESRDEKLRRRVLAYAGPVAVATWLVLFWNFPSLNQSLSAQEVPSAKPPVPEGRP